MSKLVYLFELDSVRHSQQEIETGQKILFEELVRNGNRVVLSFNQLSDSHAFLAAVQNKKSYDKILELFQAGALQVSLYGKTRTPSQYMQDSLDKCLTTKEGSFWFSGIPVERTNTALLNELKLALQYSDPERLMNLYQKALKSEGAEEKTCERLEYLYRFVKMILLISKEKKATNPAKEGEKKNLLFFYEEIKKYQTDIANMPNDQPSIQSVSNWKELFKNAVQQLKIIENRMRKTAVEKQNDIPKYMTNRSNWYKEILLDSKVDVPAANQSVKEETLALAEAIIDLCYNYTIEDSISGVAKHYKENDDADFLHDFCQRMDRYWTDYCNQNHIFYEEDRTDCIEYQGELPDWKLAASLWKNNTDTRKRIQAIRDLFILPELKRSNEASYLLIRMQEQKASLYEQNLRQEQLHWKLLTCASLVFQIVAAFVLVILFLILNIAMGYLESYADVPGMTLQIFQNSFANAVLLAVIETAAISLLTSIVSGIFHVPDILDSCKRVLQCICNLGRFFRVPEGLAYVHKK